MVQYESRGSYLYLLDTVDDAGSVGTILMQLLGQLLDDVPEMVDVCLLPRGQDGIIEIIHGVPSYTIRLMLNTGRGSLSGDIIRHVVPAKVMIHYRALLAVLYGAMAGGAWFTESSSRLKGFAGCMSVGTLSGWLKLQEATSALAF
jgi:hypothetical protein